MQAKHLNHAVDVVRVYLHFLFCARAWLQHFLEVGMSYLEFGTVLVSVYCVNRAPAACPRLAGISTRHRDTLIAYHSLTLAPHFVPITLTAVHHIQRAKGGPHCAVLIHRK